MPDVEVLLSTVTSDTGSRRLDASKALRHRSEHEPESVYPHLEPIVDLLRHENSIVRWNAILTLSHLAPVDRERRLDQILDRYLACIEGPHLIDAANTIRGAGRIAAAKPYLADTIVGRILCVEQARYATPECRLVAIGHALDVLDGLFPLLSETRAVQLFASRQMRSTRSSTRQKAERFLRKRPLAKTARNPV